MGVLLAQPNIEIIINVSQIVGELQRIGEDTKRGVAIGLNAAAKGLKQEWLDEYDKQIEGGPTAFTKRIFAPPSRFNSATPNNLTSSTRIPAVQSDYLSFILGGRRQRTPRDIGGVGSSILIPVKARLTKKGNFLGGAPTRWLGSLEQRFKGKAFVGSPSGEGGQGAVYQRLKKGKLKLLAIFEDRTNYNKTLDLDRVTEQFIPKANDFMQEGLDKFLE